MDWTAGYNSDVQYTAGFYQEQSPAHLNFICALNGYEPISTDEPFTYCELGFGRGVTVNLLAAANPNGQFYATDFNPAHVAGASALADAAKLDNLTLLESSFEELAKGQVPNVPQFDFVTMHGVYTWVTAENRAYIVEFLRRYLKPGGIVFVSYNAMPGWSSVLPLQRLLVEYGDNFPGRSVQQLDGAAKFVHQLIDAKAQYFEQNPRLDSRLQNLKTGDRAYLAHEYLHKCWAPMYHADVARELGQAKLDFAGVADLPLNFPTLFLNQEHINAMAGMPDAAMRETLKDYILNASFRKDIYIKGARQMSATRRREWMSKVRLMLTVPRSAVSFKMKLAVGDTDASPALYGPVCDALAERPHTLLEILRLPALAGKNMDNVIQIAALLSASGQAALVIGSPAADGVAVAARMNRALAADSHQADELRVLCSPVMRSAIPATLVERLVVGLLLDSPTQRDVNILANQVWVVIVGMGRSMLKDGKALDTAEDNLAELRSQIQVILTSKLPMWRQAQVVA